MKKGIQNIIGTAVVMLVWIGPMVVRAQNPENMPAPVAAENSVAPATLPPEIDPASPLGQVIQMLQAGSAPNSVLAYITNAGTPFNLTAAGHVYLDDLGTPAAVETALIQHDKELGVTGNFPSSQPPSPAQTQLEQDITEDYFYNALAPYGTWMNIPGYGLCWRPYAAIDNSGWTPYGTRGQWLYSDCGWYWLSGYSWGWCAFHYGRWFRDPDRGWCWWPSSAWAPSWVFWRYSGKICGWAPLPPHCYYSQAHGLVYNGAAVSSHYDFGIGADVFNFVPMAKLCDNNPERYRLSAAQVTPIFAQSIVLAAINSNDRTIVDDGIPVMRIAMASGGDMRGLTIQPIKSVAIPGARGEQILPDGKTLAVNCPYINANAPSSLRQGIWPVPSQEQPVAHQPPTIIVNENPLSYTPPANQDNSVIYVDRAGQNLPPVPTVTTAGPQDNAAPAPGGVAAQNYWADSSAYAAPPAPVETASDYMSPRLHSHEHWQHHVQPDPGHREFHPPSSRPPSGEPHQTGEPHSNQHPTQTQPHDHPPTNAGEHSAAPGGDNGHARK